MANTLPDSFEKQISIKLSGDKVNLLLSRQLLWIAPARQRHGIHLSGAGSQDSTVTNTK